MSKTLVIFVLSIVVYVFMRLMAEAYSTTDNYFFWGWMTGVFVSGCVKLIYTDD